jgi:hypothetical protein
MKPHHSNQAQVSSSIAGSMVATPMLMTALVIALLSSAALAQSATNFDTKALTPDAPVPTETKVAKPVSTEAGPGITIPSRKVGPAELEAYMASLSSVFMIRERTLDPFGMPQDPDAKPIIKAPVAGAVKRIAPILATPFPEIIQKIVVTTIMPGEKRFLVGTKSVKQGDQLPLLFRGKQIITQVIEVTSRQIVFKNLDNGEVATRQLDMLPVGMTPGSHGIRAPGMTLDRSNAPIELESGDSAP